MKELIPFQKRTQFYWNATRAALPLLSTPYFHYTHDICPEIDGNYLVVSNHVSPFDPLLVALSFKRQMYYLAGENISRMGFWSWAIKNTWQPIIKTSNRTDNTSMKKMLDYLRKGKNVCIFPEGLRTFTGVTEPIEPSIGKLVKVAKVNLVTYKVSGLFFSLPRWSKHVRPGKSHGQVVNVYTKEQLAKMKPEEIYTIISNDIYENAYETQEKNPVRYKRKKRAQGLDGVLFACTSCNSLDTLETKNEILYCSKCGAKAEFTEYGLIEGDFKYKKIPDWDNWQKDLIEKKSLKALQKNSIEPILREDNLELKLLTHTHKEFLKSSGTFNFYTDRLSIGDRIFYFNEIDDFNIPFGKAIIFTTTKNETFQIASDSFKCGRSYFFAFQFIRNQTN